MLTPKLFELRNPYQTATGDAYCELFIAPEYHGFVQAQPYILHVQDFMSMPSRLHLHFDPRYDYEEAWLELYEALSNETQKIQLPDIWGIDSE